MLLNHSLLFVLVQEKLLPSSLFQETMDPMSYCHMGTSLINIVQYLDMSGGSLILSVDTL